MFGLSTPTPRVRCPKNGVVCLGLDVAAGWEFVVGSSTEAGWGSAVGLNFTDGLEFAAGVENAPGESRFPC